MPNYAKLGYLKFMPYGFKDGKEDVFIRNLKIAEGGLDLRSQLLKDGKVSTNGILFDAGSDRLKPESYGVIRQIALALQEQPALNLRVIGHTDSDGDEAVNLKLSQSRAAAVRQALIDDYGIAQERLQTDGKGEASPIGDNTTLAGKANNRRVEFVKI
jgi:outer membrane protein OmpA-like peptidoglycan-associated protein